MDEDNEQAIVAELVTRGVNRETAEKLARDYPDECRRQLGAFDVDIGAGGNVGAYLHAAIEQRWAVPRAQRSMFLNHPAVRKRRRTEFRTDSSCAYLALGFPSLRRAPGIEPWDAEALDRWAARPDRDPAARAAAQLVLGLVDSGRDWTCGRFDLREALAVWDCDHGCPFLSFLQHCW
jgi:hypothetical protein